MNPINLTNQPKQRLSFVDKYGFTVSAGDQVTFLHNRRYVTGILFGVQTTDRYRVLIELNDGLKTYQRKEDLFLAAPFIARFPEHFI